MKVLMLWRYYTQYLEYFYSQHPHVATLPFFEHREEILDDHFGWPGELSRYMRKNGIETEFVIVNAEMLQKRWAYENDVESFSLDNWEREIAFEQIKRFKPDILWLPSMFQYFGDFVKEALPYCKKAITWISCKVPSNLDISGFTDLITSDPHILRERHNEFKSVTVVKPGFDPEILRKLENVSKDRDDVVFIGQVSKSHRKRTQVLSYLIEKGVNIKMYGFMTGGIRPSLLKSLKSCTSKALRHGDVGGGVKHLREWLKKDPYQNELGILREAYVGPAFGMDMYRIIAASKIALNIHIDVANEGKHSSNMRMFETTGVGTCLATENFDNLPELFNVDKEVMAYNSKEELLELLESKLGNDSEIQAMAKSGQERTLREHTLEDMFKRIEGVLSV